MAKRVMPMSPREATDCLRAKARDPAFALAKTRHFSEQLSLRDFVMGDVLHLFKQGFVLLEAQRTTHPCEFKYIFEGVTLNSGGRTVAVVVIPSPTPMVKVVTVMWRDEVRVGP